MTRESHRCDSMVHGSRQRIKCTVFPLQAASLLPAKRQGFRRHITLKPERKSRKKEGLHVGRSKAYASDELDPMGEARGECQAEL